MFYRQQNILLRKKIREIDMNFETNPNDLDRSETSFVVVGPNGSGKTSLLRYVAVDIGQCSLLATAVIK